MIGQHIGWYELTGKLGEGGMGEVYRATDTKLDRQVAIKVLPAAFTEDPDRLARFEREAKLLAQLRHPYIASIFITIRRGVSIGSSALARVCSDSPSCCGPTSLTPATKHNPNTNITVHGASRS